MNQKKFIDNIGCSEEWLLSQIIKTDFNQKQTNKIQYVKIKKIDLLNLVLKFLKLNERESD